MSENKITTYLLYAAGEIILVVVGILIAVQIDEWSNSKTDQKIEISYMQNMLEDMKADIAVYSNYKAKNSLVLLHIDSLVYSLKSPDRKLLAAKSSYWGRILTTEWERAQPIERTFEQMKSSGQLKLITKKNVADGISKYYNSLYKLETYNEALLIWLNNYISHMGKVFDGEVLLKILKERQPPPFSDHIIITDDFGTINELITSAQYVYGAIQLSERITEDRIITAQKLVSLIQEEYQLN